VIILDKNYTMKYLFVFITLVIGVNSMAQSKKEQIAILTIRLDSLNKEYIKDTTYLSNTVETIDREYSILSMQNDEAQDVIKKKSATISEKTNTIKSLNKKNMELMEELKEMRKSLKILTLENKRMKQSLDTSKKLIYTYYDKDDVISGYEEMKEDAQGHYDALLEINTSWAEDKKEMLKDYEGKEDKLIEKAAKDDDAKGALEDYRNRQFKYEKALWEQNKSWGEANWGLEKANSDQKQMLEGDAKKKFDDAIRHIEGAVDRLRKECNDAVYRLNK